MWSAKLCVKCDVNGDTLGWIKCLDLDFQREEPTHCSMKKAKKETCGVRGFKHLTNTCWSTLTPSPLRPVHKVTCSPSVVLLSNLSAHTFPCINVNGRFFSRHTGSCCLCTTLALRKRRRPPYLSSRLTLVIPMVNQLSQRDRSALQRNQAPWKVLFYLFLCDWMFPDISRKGMSCASLSRQ